MLKNGCAIVIRMLRLNNAAMGHVGWAIVGGLSIHCGHHLACAVHGVPDGLRERQRGQQTFVTNA
eukprot:5688718-Amphidinium_carterae.1